MVEAEAGRARQDGMAAGLGDLLEEHLVELAEIESIDNGKPVSDAT